MPAKRYPLPKRFNVALSESAYAALRDLNQQYMFSNNYLLTILLESLHEVVDHEKLEAKFNAFTAEYGAPANKNMK